MRLQTSSRGTKNNQRHISSSFREINRKKTGCYQPITHHPSITHPSIQAGGDAWNPGGHMGKATTSQESYYQTKMCKILFSFLLCRLSFLFFLLFFLFFLYLLSIKYFSRKFTTFTTFSKILIFYLSGPVSVPIFRRNGEGGNFSNENRENFHFTNFFKIGDKKKVGVKSVDKKLGIKKVGVKKWG